MSLVALSNMQHDAPEPDDKEPKMSRTSGLAIVAACTVAAAGLTWAGPEANAIECHEGYQRIRGNYVATPYCGDNYLASVARSYGSRVSNAEVRNNPSKKAEICRFIGHDIRIQHLCHGYRDNLDSFSR